MRKKIDFEDRTEDRAVDRLAEMLGQAHPAARAEADLLRQRSAVIKEAAAAAEEALQTIADDPHEVIALNLGGFDRFLVGRLVLGEGWTVQEVAGAIRERCRSAMAKIRAAAPTVLGLGTTIEPGAWFKSSTPGRYLGTVNLWIDVALDDDQDNDQDLIEEAIRAMDEEVFIGRVPAVA